MPLLPGPEGGGGGAAGAAIPSAAMTCWNISGVAKGLAMGLDGMPGFIGLGISGVRGVSAAGLPFSGRMRKR